jgi:hypothetical protein
MTKRQLIDEIVTANRTAEPSFLAQFDDADLREYLRHLRWARQPRLTGNVHRYEKYFKNRGENSAPPSAAEPQPFDPPEETDTPIVPGPTDLQDDGGIDDTTERAECRGPDAPPPSSDSLRSTSEDLAQEEVGQTPPALAAAESDATDQEDQEQPSPFAKTDQPQQQEGDSQSWLF